MKNTNEVCLDCGKELTDDVKSRSAVTKDGQRVRICEDCVKNYNIFGVSKG